MLKIIRRISIIILVLFSFFVITGCTKDENKIDDTFNQLFANEDLTAVESDLRFPRSLNGVNIIYESSNPDVISDEGKVTRQKEDVTVEITITLDDGYKVQIRKVTIIVLKKESIAEQVYQNLFGKIDLMNVTTDLTLLTSMNGVTITYDSDKPNVLSNTGKVKRGENDELVKLTVTLKSVDEEITKVIDIKVLKQELSQAQIVANSLFKDVDLNNITSDLLLPLTIDNVNLTWTSSNQIALSNTGKVTRTSTNQTVTLIVNLDDGKDSVSKSFTITIPKDNALYIEQVYSTLFSVDLSKVTNNLSFPTSKNGVTIAYESTNPDVVSNTGIVKRGEEDQEVTVKLTLTYEGLTINKAITITVLKLVTPTYPIINGINASLNQSVTVQGIVIGNVGDSLYINDGNDGIYLYKAGTNYKIGDEIRVTGVRADYAGLIQLKNINNVSVVKENSQISEALTIANLKAITKQATLYSINNLTVISSDLLISGQDVFITVEDSAHNTMDIIISKHLVKSTYNAIANKLGDIKVGDTINLNNIISGYYNNFQLQLTNANQISITHLGDEPVVTTNPIDPYYPKPEDMKFLQDELDKYLTSGITPIGEANVLIIPINFTDYTISNEDLARLEIAFFGTSEETGWESVKSYYAKSSYGKFNFNGRILEPFQTNRASTYYAKKYNSGIDADYEIIKAVLEYYDDTIDYSEYDNNNDGYIDGLYFIYATPSWYGDNTGSVNDSDLWWAYVYQYYTDEIETYDGVEANYYLWAGIDFIDEAFIDDGYSDVNINVNAVTYIHETGHMLGLYDYYDYKEGKGPEGGLGGADMMDYNVGDHNSFSKIMLNWVTPLVVSGKSTTVTLASFTESGDVVLVSPNWHNTYFDEYFLIEFYTPTFLNEAQVGQNGLYSIYGIRILHVNATINPNQEDNQELFLYNNSDTTRKILKPIEADNDNSIEQEMIAEDEDLFLAGDEFGMSTNYHLSNGQLVDFTIKVLSITNEQAQIEIVFN